MSNEYSGVRIGRIHLELLLRFAVAGALVGHGGYGAVMAKSSWYGYFAVLGVSESAVESAGLMRVIGGAEIALGITALLFPVPLLLLFLTAWKLFTELL